MLIKLDFYYYYGLVNKLKVPSKINNNLTINILTCLQISSAYYMYDKL